MALADNRWQRTTTLCAMYFAQGFPWGFMATALVAYLVGQGISDAETANLTAIVLVPWTFKLVWAPLIDSMTYRAMGRRRVWIIGSELMMAVSLLGILWVGDLAENLQVLGWMFFVHNCFASLQDVATDALAVDILPPGEQGRLAGLMWGVKLGGKGAGGLMAYVIRDWGLEAAVAIQMAVLLAIMVLPLYFVERRGEKRFPWSPGTAKGVAAESSLRSPVYVLVDLCRGFMLLPTFVHAVVGTCCVAGWGIVEVVSKLLYINQLGWDYVEVSGLQASAVSMEVLGALGGGIIADRFGRRKVMLLGFGVYGLMHVAFAVGNGYWGDRQFTTAYLFINPGLVAMGAVGFNAMAMKVSWTRAAATMFTMYMTLTNVGHVIGNKAVAWLREGGRCTYEQIFWVAGILCLAPLMLLPLVNPARVDAAEENERLADSHRD